MHRQETPLPAISKFLVAAILVAGCASVDRTVTAPRDTAERESGSAKAKPAASTPIAVTVEDQGPSGAFQIQSDGLGEYSNGVQGMLAEIDSYGNLQISPNNLNSSTPPQRTLRIDHSDPADPLNAYRPDGSAQHNFKIKSNKLNNGNPRIQDLGVNGNPASGCYNVTIAHATATTRYQNDFNPAAFPQATYVYITRTSISPAAWTMVSDGPCIVNPTWSGLSSQDLTGKRPQWISRGYYRLHLSIRFRAL